MTSSHSLFKRHTCTIKTGLITRLKNMPLLWSSRWFTNGFTLNLHKFTSADRSQFYWNKVISPWNLSILNAGVTGLLCCWKERYSGTTAGAWQPNSVCVRHVTQKNQPANRFQFTAPIQSHNLPLHYKILVKYVKNRANTVRFRVKANWNTTEKERLWSCLIGRKVVKDIWNIIDCNTTERVQ